MDKQGHERIQTVAAEAGFHVADMNAGKAAVKYVTAQVSRRRPEDLLNALDEAHLMASHYDGPRDAVFISGPQLEVVASSNDWVTLEDVNMGGTTY
ncbi:MAG: hypothetical protein JWM81_551 [Candidatus Saccharibacteria bacterium]|nr:hypothetical protein [Candidatus Saccharibacteria bacterium]